MGGLDGLLGWAIFATLLTYRTHIPIKSIATNTPKVDIFNKRLLNVNVPIYPKISIKTNAYIEI
jgi:hypothetical protein